MAMPCMRVASVSAPNDAMRVAKQHKTDCHLGRKGSEHAGLKWWEVERRDWAGDKWGAGDCTIDKHVLACLCIACSQLFTPTMTTCSRACDLPRRR